MATRLETERNNVITFIANPDNARLCSTYNLITNNYGTVTDRKVAAFIFENSWLELQQQGLPASVGFGRNSYFDMKKSITTDIVAAGGNHNHNSYLLHLDYEAKCAELKNELQLTSLTIPEARSLDLKYGYNGNDEIGLFHNIHLNENRRSYIDASFALRRYKIDNPGQASRARGNKRSDEYQRLNNTVFQRRKELKALTTELEEDQKVFEQNHFAIDDILLPGANDGLVQLVKGMQMSIELTIAEQARYAANGKHAEYEEMPFVPPDLPEQILSNLLPKDLETLSVYQGVHEQWKAFSGGTKTERENLIQKRRYHGRKMTKTMMNCVAIFCKILFDRANPDAVNLLRYMDGNYEKAEANFRKHYRKEAEKNKAAYAHYKDITKNLGQAWKANKPMNEIAKLEQEASQAWTHTTGYKKYQKIAIGSCTYVDLLNDAADNYKLRRIVKG